MADDYYAMARVMRQLRRAPPGTWPRRDELAFPTRLSLDRVAAAVDAMGRRDWVVQSTGAGDVAIVQLVGDAAGWGDLNEAQLLAQDLVSAIGRKAWTTPFDVRDLPKDLRADGALLTLALDELERARVLRLHRSSAGGAVDRVIVLPGWKTHAFGSTGETPGVQVHGDVVGRDKNVNAGSGAIVTGDHNTICTESAETRESLLELIAELRKNRALHANALNRLAKATSPGASAFVVAEHASQAVKLETRLLEPLKSWCTSLAGKVVDETVAIGVRLALQSVGALPPSSP